MVEESPDSVVPAATAAEKKAKPAATDTAAPEKSVPPKKEKPPAVEAKPFTEFIQHLS